jgi:DNA-binding PadR family transcriptional regulator
MEPFERFKNLSTNGNIWIYILSLSKEGPLPKSKVRSLVFEKFGFLPARFITSQVLRKLENNSYINSQKFKGEKSYIITRKGSQELEKVKDLCQNILKKL